MKSPLPHKKLPQINPDLKPIYAGISPNFDNLWGSDFKDLKDYFALTATGYMQVEEAGKYIIELWSDDGSKLWLPN